MSAPSSFAAVATVATIAACVAITTIGRLTGIAASTRVAKRKVTVIQFQHARVVDSAAIASITTVASVTAIATGDALTTFMALTPLTAGTSRFRFITKDRLARLYPQYACIVDAAATATAATTTAVTPLAAKATVSPLATTATFTARIPLNVAVNQRQRARIVDAATIAAIAAIAAVAAVAVVTRVAANAAVAAVAACTGKIVGDLTMGQGQRACVIDAATITAHSAISASTLDTAITAASTVRGFGINDPEINDLDDSPCGDRKDTGRSTATDG